MKTWKLRRTAQCEKCPWIAGVDPHEIPNGYIASKHAALASTIAPAADVALQASRYLAGDPMRAMACHETHDAHCVGWVANQLGPGNNIALRLQVRGCENIGKAAPAWRAAPQL